VLLCTEAEKLASTIFRKAIQWRRLAGNSQITMSGRGRCTAAGRISCLLRRLDMVELVGFCRVEVEKVSGFVGFRRVWPAVNKIALGEN
jgi:hypothetical protein